MNKFITYIPIVVFISAFSLFYYFTTYRPTYKIDCDKKYIDKSDSSYYQLYLKVKNRNSHSSYYTKSIDVSEKDKDSVINELDKLGQKLVKTL
jgi:hypothetical protein